MRKFNVFSVFMLIICLSALNAFNVDSKDFSEKENRELAAKPEFKFESLLNGSYFKDVEAYFTDRFFERDVLVEISGKIKSMLSDNPIKSAAESKSDKKTSIIKMDGSSNPVIRYGDGMYFVFKSNKSEINRYAKALNSIYYNLSSNVNMSVMLVPTALEFVENSAEKFGITPQSEQIEYARKTINGGIVFADVYDTMKQHSDEYVYFRSDHHWTPLGAYYSYCRYAEIMGLTPAECRLEIAGNFSGSFINYTNDPSAQEVTDMMSLQRIEIPYWCHGSLRHAKDAVQMESMYHENLEGYKRILGGDTGYIRVETMNETDRRLLIVKDSFANALLPYLTENYNRIIMIDPRYFEDDIFETIENEQITDVLFVNNTETISDDAFIAKLEQLSGKK